jgi:uncharacterized membrane protein YfcA
VDDALRFTWLVAAAFGGGVMNALAGGGTLLTYPALVAAGINPIAANATSTVALLPGALTSAWGYRRELAGYRRWLGVLGPPSLVGGGLGSLLLLATPADAFSRLAPLLVLFATGLFVLQGWRARRAAVAPRVAAEAERGSAAAPPDEPVPSPARFGKAARQRLLVAALLQLLVGVYGGYFGAGIGILMLAILGFLGIGDIHAANGTKNLCGLAINGVAAAWFLLRGAVDLPLALLMAGGAAAGGLAGAGLARFVGRDAARHLVVVIGVLATVLLFLQAD